MEPNTTPNLNLVAEITLKYNPNIPASKRPVVNCAADAHKIFMSTWDKDILELQEQFKIMLLNRNNRVLGVVTTSTGGITGTIADPKVIFAAALKGAASSVILAHNHPSGNLSPSNQDKTITRKLSQIGVMLEINVVDHLIFTTDSYYSFSENGIL